MLISSPSLIFIITTLAAAAVGLCYLPIVSDIVSAITERQKKKRLAQQSAKQLERKLLSYHQNVLDKIEARAGTDIATAVEKVEKILTEQLNTISGKHSESLSQLSAAIKGDYEKNRQELKAATDNYLDETEIALDGLVEKAAGRVDDELTKQLQTTRAELADYKKRQTKKIDDEIAVLVEKTIYKTLGKVLSPKDQTDLIYEALAEAKEEGFFISSADKR